MGTYVALLFASAFVLLFLAVSNSSTFWALMGYGAACVVLVAFTILLGVRSWRRTRCGNRYGRLLWELAMAGKPLTDDQVNSVHEQLTSKVLRPGDREYFAQRAYIAALAEIVHDQQADNELRLLSQLEATLSLDHDFIAAARLDVFRSA